MNTQRTKEVLYETEATLRLVDHGLLGLRNDTTDVAAASQITVHQGSLSELPAILERAHAQLLGIHSRLRQNRAETGTIARENPDSSASATDIRSNLTDELALLMGAPQVHDINAQQLARAAAVLEEMEARLIEIAALFYGKAELSEQKRFVHPSEDAAS